MRTPEQIEALVTAARIEARFLPDVTPPRIEVWKGEPPVFVCSEPMPTVHWNVIGDDGDAAERVIPAPVVGPVSLLAVAWHLGLTPEEAEAYGYTPERAFFLLADHVKEACARAGIDEVPELERINPDDPRWGRP